MAKISFLWIGKTREPWIRDGIALYLKKIAYFVRVEVMEPKDSSKKRSKSVVSLKKGSIPERAFKVLLDETGREYSSIEFSRFLNLKLQTPPNHVIFLLGGPYGFHNHTHDMADHCLSLSRLTFTHDMARVILVEQVYRALCIERGLPYHHG